jgi:hypothetical protein
MNRTLCITPRLVAAAVLLFLAYIGAYFAMVHSTAPGAVRSVHSIKLPFYFPPMVKQMKARTADRIDRVARVVFAPVHAFDRRLRPTMWQ